jgi:hypothetical protein
MFNNNATLNHNHRATSLFETRIDVEERFTEQVQ